MRLQPRLIDVAVPARPAGVVLALHGGASRRDNMMVSPTQLSVLRMIPIAKRIAPGLDGRRLLIVHGSRDRIASPQRSAALASALARVADVEFVTVDGARHAMLRHHAVFSRLAADFATETLLGPAG